MAAVVDLARKATTHLAESAPLTLTDTLDSLDNPDTHGTRRSTRWQGVAVGRAGHDAVADVVVGDAVPRHTP